MGFWGDAEQGVTNPGQGIESIFGLGPYDPTNSDRNALTTSAQQQLAFGQQQGQFGQSLQNAYAGNQAGIANTQGMLQGLANGQNSVSAAQLNQGLQQSQAQQMSMAAGAAPQNQAMAARTAMMNTGNQAQGMMGQQLIAGNQERQGALNALSQMQMQQSGQNMQGALGAAQTANAAYGGQNAAYNTALQYPQASGSKMIGGAVGGIAAAISDERLKTNVTSADDDASKSMDELSAYKFDYRDPRHGEGRQLGVMAQDLERAGLGHVVIETPDGKAVDGAKLELSNTAMIAALHKRLSKLEGK